MVSAAGVTNADYWDEVADEYDGEIHDSLNEDLNGILRDRIGEHCRAPWNQFTLDFGCGVGKYVPCLAARSKFVLAVDISAGLLRHAEEKCHAIRNVEFRQIDCGADGAGDGKGQEVGAPGSSRGSVPSLPAPAPASSQVVSTALALPLQLGKLGKEAWETCATDDASSASSSSRTRSDGNDYEGLPFGKVTFLVCTNVIISPDDKVNQIMFRNIKGCLVPSGKLLLLAPAVESAQLACDVLHEWRAHQKKIHALIKKRGKSGGKAGGKLRLEKGEFNSPQDIQKGVYRRDGVRTKHHTSEGIQEELQRHGFRILSVDKVEYAWDTEYHGAGAGTWLPECRLRPWDWLVMAQFDLATTPQTMSIRSSASGLS